MIPKPTEDTVTNLLVKELEKYGVKAEVFPSISTPSGIRKPDIWCSNGGAYVIEAKFKESELISAIAKIQNDYIKWFDILGIKGGFAVLYPEELTNPMPPDTLIKLASQAKFKVVALFPPKDLRKSFTVYEGSLAEVAKILAEHVLTPPEYVEPSTGYIIKALRDSAEYITTALKYLSGRELEDIFGGKEVFKNILQYEEQKYPVEALRLASAYLLVNQLLFYHVLSRKMPEKFPEIDADVIRKPADLNIYFKNVLNVNYRTVFSYDVASRIPPVFTDQVKAVINVIKGLSPEKAGGDLLGTIFHDLIPFQVRKAVAAFYTNVLAAELLAWLSIDDYECKVADFAVGSGGLLVAAYRRKRYLLEKERRFTEADHKRFVENELLGIDVMLFAANVAACHLALQSPEYFTDKVNIAIWDSTELEPGRTIPSIAALKFVLKGQTPLDMYFKPAEGAEKAKGVVSLTGEVPEEIKLEKYDVVIMNPPFTRQERIPKEYKAILDERFRDYKDYLHGQLGYFGYFIFLADRFLKSNGKMALVLPATILRVKSCEGIRKLWAERYHVEHIIATWQRSAFSESVRFREILLVARKCKPDGNAKTTVTILKKLPQSFDEAQKIATLIKFSKEDIENDRVFLRIIDYSRLRGDISNWFKFISLKNLYLLDIFEQIFSTDKFVKLSSIAGTVRGFELRGGLVTKLIINSSIDRALKSKDIWVLSADRGEYIVSNHKSLPLKIKILKKAVRRTLRRAAGLDRIDVTQELDYIIVEAWDEEEFSNLKRIANLKIHSKELERVKADVEKRMGNLYVVRRLDLSAPGTSALAFYSSEPAAPVKLFWSYNLNEETSKILALFLNSSLNLLQILVERAETRGAFIEISEYILDQFRVISPTKLSESEKKYLLNVFDEVAQQEIPSLLDQLKSKHPVRRVIDEAFLKILGYNGDVNVFLDSLYEALAEEIVILKRVMTEKT